MKKDLDPTPALPSTREEADRAASGSPSPSEGGGREGVRRQKHFNPPSQKSTRQNLRRNLTAPERFLWQKIRGRQLGVKFRRQHGIGRYIVDFYCPEHALVIEVDGDSHYSTEAQDYDRKRSHFMHTLGIKTLRFTNAEVMGNIEGIILTIQQKIQGASKN